MVRYSKQLIIHLFNSMKDELRESLFICLNTEEIIYQVDNDNNVLIKKMLTMQLHVVHKN